MNNTELTENLQEKAINFEEEKYKLKTNKYKILFPVLMIAIFSLIMGLLVAMGRLFVFYSIDWAASDIWSGTPPGWYLFLVISGITLNFWGITAIGINKDKLSFKGLFFLSLFFDTLFCFTIVHLALYQWYTLLIVLIFAPIKSYSFSKIVQKAKSFFSFFFRLCFIYFTIFILIIFLGSLIPDPVNAGLLVMALPIFLVISIPLVIFYCLFLSYLIKDFGENFIIRRFLPKNFVGSFMTVLSIGLIQTIVAFIILLFENNFSFSVKLESLIDLDFLVDSIFGGVFLGIFLGIVLFILNYSFFPEILIVTPENIAWKNHKNYRIDFDEIRSIKYKGKMHSNTTFVLQDNDQLGVILPKDLIINGHNDLDLMILIENSRQK